MCVRSAEKEAFWRMVVDEQKASGLSVRQFCKRESISEPSFYAWRKELQRRDDEEQLAGALIPVEVVRHEVSEQAASLSVPLSNRLLEIEAPNGFKLRFDCDLKVPDIHELLGMVASCSSGASRC